MKCPFCNSDSKVVESRSSDERTRRRRRCVSCGKRFTTYEMIENTPLVVIKKDGSREFFDRKKIFDGLLKACQKRPVPMEHIDEIVRLIEAKLQNMLEREVESKLIGEMAMESLRPIDEVSYVRFASVYRQFKDINGFLGELKNLLERG
ncbi:MAG: transcriptional regulator NrdR [Oscillospiraceae bacterium]|nr:transcriptional regulator NrdR [Oscillospiraceae bacterium]